MGAVKAAAAKVAVEMAVAAMVAVVQAWEGLVMVATGVAAVFVVVEVVELEGDEQGVAATGTDCREAVLSAEVQMDVAEWVVAVVAAVVVEMEGGALAVGRWEG